MVAICGGYLCVPALNCEKKTHLLHFLLTISLGKTLKQSLSLINYLLFILHTAARRSHFGPRKIRINYNSIEGKSKQRSKLR